jgi:hypothetical protein
VELTPSSCAHSCPQDPDYPKSAEFHAKFGPRGVLKCVATDTADPAVDPRFGKVGKQKITDTGPLTRKRMETVENKSGFGLYADGMMELDWVVGQLL